MTDLASKIYDIYTSLLTKLYRRVFGAIQHFARTYKHCFPSLKKLAELCHCGIRTVQRALKKLAEYGFLGWIKRPYQSNEYFVPDDLIYVDFNDERLALRQPSPDKCPPNGHVYNNTNTYNSTESNPVDSHIAKNKQKAAHVPEFLKIRCLKPDQQQTLANNFSEYVLHEAIEGAKWFARQGKKITNHAGLIWNIAKKLKRRIAV